MKIATAARRHGLNARKVVAFIRNRHCSRFPLHVSLDYAIATAVSYHTEEETIAADIQTVGSYGDLDQYTRNWQPFYRLRLRS
jgi:hypothetical protein